MSSGIDTTSNVNTANLVVVDWNDLISTTYMNNNGNSEITNCTTTSTTTTAPPSTKNNDKIAKLIQSAYGANGIGILAIRNVPGFVTAKEAFLPQAHALATLESTYLEEHLTDPTSLYNAGWSYGKEKLGANKPPDIAKGSFYYNPINDVPGTMELRQQYPYSYPCNKWPADTVIPQFVHNAKTIGVILSQACVEVARHIDALAIQSCPTYPSNLLYQQLNGTDRVKARLLYYFPMSPPPPTAETEPEISLLQQHQSQQSIQLPIDTASRSTNRTTTTGSSTTTTTAATTTTTTTVTPTNTTMEEDSWIGWHNDSGFLTALAGELYVDHATGALIPQCPDPEAGLYVWNRRAASDHNIKTNSNENDTTNNLVPSTSSEIIRVIIPHDCLAVQIGECTQIVTGGVVRATPHCVRGIRTQSLLSSSSSSSLVKGTSIARIALPCFVDTAPDFVVQVPPGGGAVTTTTNERQIVDATFHKVPPLQDRWTNGDTFGTFLQKTFQLYYNWK